MKRILSCQNVSHRTIPSAEVKQFNKCCSLQQSQLDMRNCSSTQGQVHSVLLYLDGWWGPMGSFWHGNCCGYLHSPSYSSWQISADSGWRGSVTYDPSLDPVGICTEKEICEALCWAHHIKSGKWIVSLKWWKNQSTAVYEFCVKIIQVIPNAILDTSCLARTTNLFESIVECTICR